jgi:Tol biopolymer transport system component
MEYEFGEFQLDTSEAVLRRAGAIVPLTPKAEQALELLLQSGGRVVSRKEMIAALWPDLFVEDSNLTVTVSMLRKALGDGANGLKFIETVAKRGYRFRPAVTSTDKAATAPASPFNAMQIVRLTHDGHVMDVALGPYGKLLAYVSIEAGKQTLWIQNLDSNERRQLSEPDPALYWGLRFTSDAQNLFFITTQPNSTISVLYRMSVLGGLPRRVVMNIDIPISLSPDGTRLTFVRSFPGQHKDVLIVANVDGSAEHEIATRNHPDKFSFASPSWTPDGKLIALGASRDNGMEFAVIGVPLDSTAPKELSRWQWQSMCAVAWSGDGKSLYFSAVLLKSNSFQIWGLSYPECEVHRITNDPNNYEEISVAEKTSSLVTMQTEALANLWLVPAAGAARRLTSGRTEGFEGVALAGRRVIYASTTNQVSDLWSINADGTDRRRLTGAGGFLPCASRDGRRVAYVSAAGGTLHIWCMDADGGNNQQLTDGGGESYPGISPDAEWVVYTSLTRERNTLWRISTRGGEPVQLTRNSIAIKPVVSPDGTRLACAYRLDEADNWKIAVLPVDGGWPLQTLALPYPYNQVIRWTPDGRALTYLERRNGVYNIWLQPLNGAAPRQITSFTEDVIYFYDWLQDGSVDSVTDSMARVAPEPVPDAREQSTSLADKNQPTANAIVARGIKTRDIVLIKNFA